jgi:hypothetical protein
MRLFRQTPTLPPNPPSLATHWRDAYATRQMPLPGTSELSQFTLSLTYINIEITI